MAYTDLSPIIMQGKVFVQERQFNAAATSGLEYLGNCENAKLSFKQKRERIVDNFSGRGLTVASPVVETEVEMMLTMLDIGSANFARTTWGTHDGAEEAGSVAAESIVMYNDRYVQLAKTGVSNVVVAGAVLDTDYTVDSAPHGRLKVLAGSTAAPDGTPFETTVAYDYAANNGIVQAYVTSQKFYTIVIDGVNVAQGNQPFILTIHQIQLDAAKALDFIDKKQMKLESGGEILIDSSIADDGELSQIFTLRRG
jgi:surface antigen